MVKEMRKQEKIEILLKEYSETQNSAQFHDNLLWTVTSIILAGMFAAIGFLINNLLSLDKAVISLFVIFSIILIMCLGIFSNEFRKIKNSKYRRCKDIEKQIRILANDSGVMLQHSSIEEGKQKYAYNLLLISLAVFLFFILIKINL